MIQTKKGKPQLPDKWWIGLTVVCDICEAEAMLEPTDRPRNRQYQAGRCMIVKCPTENCKGYMHVEKPDLQSEADQ